jgi:hypothetical protein
MHIDNKKQVAQINIIFSLIIITILLFLGAHYLLGIFTDEDMIFSLWTALIVVVFLFRYGGFDFVMIDFGDDEIDIKYYRVFPFGRKFNRIVIPNELLGYFKIQKGAGPLFSSLILFQNRSGEMAQYPPIGMAAVNNDMQKKLLEQLNKVSGE